MNLGLQLNLNIQVQLQSQPELLALSFLLLTPAAAAGKAAQCLANGVSCVVNRVSDGVLNLVKPLA